MSDTRTIQLEPPLADHWITVRTEQKMRTWLALQEAAAAATQSPDPTSIGAALALFAPLIVAHNLLDVETGAPLVLSFEEMTPAQIRGVLTALMEAFPGGASADPLPPTKPKPPRSPKHSSPSSRSRSTSPSSS